MGFGGNHQVFEKYSTDFNAATFPQGAGFKHVDESAMKTPSINNNASNSNMYGGGYRLRHGSSNSSIMQLPAQMLPSQTLQAWPVAYQAMPNVAVFSDYSDLRTHQARAYSIMQQQQQHQHQFQQQQQQQLAFYPDLLRGPLPKPPRNVSPLTGDMSGDALEPKRRTRRRRRRPRKSDMELAAQYGAMGINRRSPNGFDADEDDFAGDEDIPHEPSSLLSSVSSSTTLSSTSASSSARSSFLDFDVLQLLPEPMINNDPWRVQEDPSTYTFLQEDDLGVVDSCFVENEPVLSLSLSNAGPLSSCISQLLHSDMDDTKESRFESTLRSAVAWHEQLESTLYFARYE